MKSVWITRYGKPEVLEVREAADPTPGEGEVRVRVYASGINFADISARVGLYPGAPPPPCVVGYEVAGVIDALGQGVDGLEEGQRVACLTRFGGYADSVCVPVNQVMPMPEAMTFSEGAALLVNYLTAYHNIFETGPLHPGAKVLVHGAAGGVGMAAVQLLKTVPDVEIFGTASASKHDALLEAGVQHRIDYRNQDYAAEIRRITGQECPLDIVLDPLGGPDWKVGYNLLRPTGRLIAFGFANAITGTKKNMFKVILQALRIPSFAPFDVYGKDRGLMETNRGVWGVDLGRLWDEPGLLRREADDLFRLYDQGRIAPYVDSAFSFEDAAAAHQYIQDRKNIGKVILTTDHFAE
ncbi:MAG: zinc-binding dehydrogenase [Myxococcales bacterium]|nr:zinc-binding dehydrogenase [Myxococcales bacterium]